uniref:Putative secreted protein n=1 Tax=Anopheles triannulatus TaxID=58253 RepID=A0A2M4B1T2_9DIPT
MLMYHFLVVMSTVMSGVVNSNSYGDARARLGVISPANPAWTVGRTDLARNWADCTVVATRHRSMFCAVEVSTIFPLARDEAPHRQML